MSNFKNIWVIFKREYMTRITNKTFIIMTFLGPLLIAGFYAYFILDFKSKIEQQYFHINL